jgi:hypothetical protein
MFNWLKSFSGCWEIIEEESEAAFTYGRLDSEVRIAAVCRAEGLKLGQMCEKISGLNRSLRRGLTVLNVCCWEVVMSIEFTVGSGVVQAFFVELTSVYLDWRGAIVSIGSCCHVRLQIVH